MLCSSISLNEIKTVKYMFQLTTITQQIVTDKELMELYLSNIKLGLLQATTQSQSIKNFLIFLKSFTYQYKEIVKLIETSITISPKLKTKSLFNVGAAINLFVNKYPVSTEWIENQTMILLDYLSTDHQVNNTLTLFRFILFVYK